MEQRHIALSTGVTLNVATAGEATSPAVIMLHGFPESHRTWREVEQHLSDLFYLVMPDQRGFGASDRPQDPDAYQADTLIDDIFALAEALGIERFSLVGHDWGGAIAWPAALRGDPRLVKLGIINAPHPLIFQKSLIKDEAQRAASQYITAFRTPGFEQAVEAMGYENFFEKSFRNHVDLDLIADEERWQYIDDWSRPGAMTAMLNWYRASRMIVPKPGSEATAPDWIDGPFPHVSVPTLVIWGMKDKALLPLQLDGLDQYVDDLRIVRLPDTGHFAPWEAPFAVGDALRDFLG
ncbi:MAG TPA: alpha/beta hydrolase [Sphingomicrobium sp.]